MAEDADIAQKILEVTPAIMREMRIEVRRGAKGELTIPQLRILAHLHAGTSDATTLAVFQGVSLPAISKMIDTLVERGFVQRQVSSEDRRRARILLLAKGRNFFLKARRVAQVKFSEKIAPLTDDKKAELNRGLELLAELFH